MKATAYVEPHGDTLIVDVTGANPNEPQTAVLKLWTPRSANAAAKGRVAFLAESWMDNKNPGASGRAFGSLSAITAEGRDVSAAVSDPLTVTVSFKPNEDGHFRVIAAAPHYDGTGNAGEIASRALSPEADAAHLSWWKDFWSRAAVIKITSKDGAGEYMENLRNLYLFVAAIEKGSEYPGSQAGIADMISAAQDEHRWDPSAFWHWNLRMQVAANIGAGLPELNDTYFNLYRGEPRQHRDVDPGAHERAPRCLRAGDHALQRAGHRVRIRLEARLDRAGTAMRTSSLITTREPSAPGRRCRCGCGSSISSTGDRAFLARELSADGGVGALSACVPEGRGRTVCCIPAPRMLTRRSGMSPIQPPILRRFWLSIPQPSRRRNLLGKDSELGAAATGRAAKGPTAAANAAMPARARCWPPRPTRRERT